MIWRLLILLALVFLVVPRLLRAARGGSRRPRRDVRRDENRFSHLTQQDISDADYEEIPPQK